MSSTAKTNFTDKISSPPMFSVEQIKPSRAQFLTHPRIRGKVYDVTSLPERCRTTAIERQNKLNESIDKLYLLCAE